MLGRSAWCLLVACSLVATACERKVDCDAFCAKEAACAAEISIAQRAATPEQIQSLGADDRKTLSERQLKRCRPGCQSPTMPGSMHTKWNQCIALQDCTAFADCVYH